MTTIKIAPSILAADFTRLGEDVRSVLEGGADYLHIDVMDGVFVPNISFGIPIVKSLRRAFPGVFLDVHLMITRPLRYVEDFARAGADLITVHLESDTPENIGQTLGRIRSLGVRTSLSLKPKTPAEAALPWLDRLDMILVMTVEPGFGGQSFMTDTLPKIRFLRQEIGDKGLFCDIQVDGGITEETIPLATAAGANVIVSGSAIFGKPDRARAIRMLRDAVK